MYWLKIDVLAKALTLYALYRTNQSMGGVDLLDSLIALYQTNQSMGGVDLLDSLIALYQTNQSMGGVDLLDSCSSDTPQYCQIVQPEHGWGGPPGIGHRTVPNQPEHGWGGPPGFAHRTVPNQPEHGWGGPPGFTHRTVLNQPEHGWGGPPGFTHRTVLNQPEHGWGGPPGFTHRTVFHMMDFTLVQAWLLYWRDCRDCGIQKKEQLSLLEFKTEVASYLYKQNKINLKRKGRPSHCVEASLAEKRKRGHVGRVPPTPVC
ncbi:UNVERIFIED_CONTAM: hypothetical protein FKN15_033595 [Acipenser sinensis]